MSGALYIHNYEELHVEQGTNGSITIRCCNDGVPQFQVTVWPKKGVFVPAFTGLLAAQEASDAKANSEG